MVFRGNDVCLYLSIYGHDVARRRAAPRRSPTMVGRAVGDMEAGFPATANGLM